MASVWHASGICPDASRAGGALTLGGESGLVHFLSAELDPITNDSDDTNANVSISIAQLSPSAGLSSGHIVWIIKAITEHAATEPITKIAKYVIRLSFLSGHEGITDIGASNSSVVKTSSLRTMLSTRSWSAAAGGRSEVELSAIAAPFVSKER